MHDNWMDRVRLNLINANGRRRKRLLSSRTLWEVMRGAFVSGFSSASPDNSPTWRRNAYKTVIVAAMRSDGGMAVSCGINSAGWTSSDRSRHLLLAIPRMDYTHVRIWADDAVEDNRTTIINREELIGWLTIERLEGRISYAELAPAIGSQLLASSQARNELAG